MNIDTRAAAGFYLLLGRVGATDSEGRLRRARLLGDSRGKVEAKGGWAGAGRACSASASVAPKTFWSSLLASRPGGPGPAGQTGRAGQAAQG